MHEPDGYSRSFGAESILVEFHHQFENVGTKRGRASRCSAVTGTDYSRFLRRTRMFIRKNVTVQRLSVRLTLSSRMVTNVHAVK
jgi:hypothetical protein